MQKQSICKPASAVCMRTADQCECKCVMCYVWGKLIAAGLSSSSRHFKLQYFASYWKLHQASHDNWVEVQKRGIEEQIDSLKPTSLWTQIQLGIILQPKNR